MRFDGIVIGGGPAGLMAAITAGAEGQKILLIEKNGRLGKKLLITGKGRCNVTNNCSVDEVLKNIPRNGRFLYSALNAFTPDDAMRFFESNGCALKTERGNRVFPVTDKSQSVLDCLAKQISKLNITVTNDKAIDVLIEDQSAVGVRCANHTYRSNWVILATGGVSYPTTGSTGDGYVMAQKCGHRIVPLEGSLVPLECSKDYCRNMQGLSLRNVAVKLVNGKGKTIYKDFGELLFTHFGVSGPTVLSASAHLQGDNCVLYIDLKPALDQGKLDSRLLRDLEQYQNRTMENALTDILPRSMIPEILALADIMPDIQANALRKEKRRALVDLMKAFPIPISGKRPVEEAIITSGGVATKEIDPRTMESKLVSRLYFAGEIIDCDAYTGGFNLQIAWSTGYACGVAVKNFD